MEATTNTWAVVRLSRPFVAEIVASNPLTTKAIAQANLKTDKIDATDHKIALAGVPRRGLA